jgi:acetyl esterase/lipase
MQALIGSLEHSSTRASPQIDVYLPESNPGGIGIIILPGGGYQRLAEHEGKGYAAFFQQQGIAAFVVNYRLGPAGFKHPAMLEDALAAIETIRTRYTFTTLGIMGSSAGGHLAAHAMVAYRAYESRMSLRPDFAILCYPVITLEGNFAHQGCREHLLGLNPSEGLLEETSPQHHISENTPPCFIWHTLEDAAVPVENSLLLATALRQKGVAFELHLYTKGRHGLGLNTSFRWADDCLRWIQEITQERNIHD